jgi:PTS system ascorbate-specific IIA component
MTIGVLIITHDRIGDALLETAKKMLGVCPVATEVLPVALDCDPEERLDTAKQYIDKLNNGDGVLVLTDIYGSTPANIAFKLQVDHPVTVITGLNLPMLVRILNYSSLNIDEVVRKAESGGREGVFICTPDM